ncbi:thiosulfate/3-mercaptopyruvate sulfurtransferase [Halanaerobium saccharolyticum]|uniref:thiosulfate sulfurtransferase n=1 Tax=Halanaerobium saccharolyticum TaxID=43595 RepID=A0A4R7Z8Q0_9FIRM|nr:sulfurtransferase [Halanaerobium saccharolyticum]RAK08621.1 thiosulfate/3-mercaptopyruvate sulfurtransferase [Halanaerobium saccharolyticum]TDW07236.1 thiosulfate/3-mercaptopyruvate sulfurtransferase [Halanaerobium saccharolyticum]TDX60173.1 thiosulfate/3-mercaptopyruvate sulfurtransferase [Halanaerobium saccharolyticum]
MHNYYKFNLLLIILISLLLLASLPAAAQADFAAPELLISTAELNQKLEAGNKNLKIIDVRNSARYLLGHLPDAVHMWGDDLSAVQGWVPELIPDAPDFSNLAQAKGINNDSEIVIYGEEDSPWAARLWFIFKVYAHQDVRILEGGYQAWNEADYETEILPHNPKEGDFEVRDVKNEWLVNSDTIAENMNNDNFLILDIRTEAEYKGEETNTAAPRKGRIPGSIHLEWTAVLDEVGNYKSAAEITDLFQEAGISKEKETIAVLSHNGVRAAHTFFTLQVLGYENVKLYDESWVGWSNRSDLPVEMN